MWKLRFYGFFIDSSESSLSDDDRERKPLQDQYPTLGEEYVHMLLRTPLHI